MKITTFSRKSLPGYPWEAPEGGLVWTREDFVGFWDPNGPPSFSFVRKKRGSGEETENSRSLVGTVAERRGPLMSLQDMSLGLVWKCVALTRQAAGFRPGAAYRCTEPT